MGAKMGSFAYAVCGRGHSSPENRLLFRDAERLMKEHGDTADVAAARLADACFSAGDNKAGNRWLKIFNILAATHIRSAGKGGGRRVTIQ